MPQKKEMPILNPDSVRLFEKRIKARDALRNLSFNPSAAKYAAVAGGTALAIFLGSTLGGFAQENSSSASMDKYIKPVDGNMLNTSVLQPRNLEGVLSQTPTQLDESVYTRVPEGFKYNLETGKLIPIEYEKKKGDDSKDKPKEPEIKIEKHGLSAGTIAAIAAGVVGGGALIYFLTKKKPNNNGPQPDTNPDLTVKCYKLKTDGSLELVPNAQVQIGSNTYNASNGEYTAKDIGNGSFEVNFKDSSVWNEILFVRDGTGSSSPNIEQRDFRDNSSPVSVSSNRTVILVKPGIEYAIDTLKNRLDRGDGMFKVDVSPGGTLYVVEKNIWGGDVTEASRVLKKNCTNVTNAMNGRLTLNHQTTDTSSTKMDVELRDIYWDAASHGELLNGKKITNALLKLPARAENVRFHTTFSEMMGGLTHVDQVTYFDFLNGEELNDLGKQFILLYVNADAGTYWYPSGSSNQAATLRANNRTINPTDFLTQENTSAALNVNQRIGDNANIGVSLSGRGKDKSASVRGNFKLGRGDAFVDYTLGNDVVAGFYQNILGNDIRLVYNSGTNQAQLQGKVNPVKNTSIDVYVNNLFDLSRNIRLGASYNGRYFGAGIDVDDITNPRNVVLRGNVNVEDLSAYVQYWHSTLGFNKKLVAMTYDIGNVKLVTDLSVLNDKDVDFNLNLLANNISLSLGRGIDKKAKVAVSFFYSF